MRGSLLKVVLITFLVLSLLSLDEALTSKRPRKERHGPGGKEGRRGARAGGPGKNPRSKFSLRLKRPKILKDTGISRRRDSELSAWSHGAYELKPIPTQAPSNLQTGRWQRATPSLDSSKLRRWKLRQSSSTQRPNPDHNNYRWNRTTQNPLWMAYMKWKSTQAPSRWVPWNSTTSQNNSTDYAKTGKVLRSAISENSSSSDDWDCSGGKVKCCYKDFHKTGSHGSHKRRAPYSHRPKEIHERRAQGSHRPRGTHGGRTQRSFRAMQGNNCEGGEIKCCYKSQIHKEKKAHQSHRPRGTHGGGTQGKRKGNSHGRCSCPGRGDHGEKKGHSHRSQGTGRDESYSHGSKRSASRGDGRSQRTRGGIFETLPHVIHPSGSRERSQRSHGKDGSNSHSQSNQLAKRSCCLSRGSHSGMREKHSQRSHRSVRGESHYRGGKRCPETSREHSRESHGKRRGRSYGSHGKRRGRSYRTRGRRRRHSYRSRGRGRGYSYGSYSRSRRYSYGSHSKSKGYSYGSHSKSRGYSYRSHRRGRWDSHRRQSRGCGKRAKELNKTYVYARCDVNNGSLSGYVALRQKRGHALELKVNIGGFNKAYGRTSNLYNGSHHGFHVHEFGDFSNGCSSFGGHYNPVGVRHGSPKDGHKHSGDFGNVFANDTGEVFCYLTVEHAMLTGKQSIVGRGIVIHSGEDDLGRGGSAASNTTGDAGGRLACCSIVYVAPVEDW